MSILHQLNTYSQPTPTHHSHLTQPTAWLYSISVRRERRAKRLSAILFLFRTMRKLVGELILNSGWWLSCWRWLSSSSFFICGLAPQDKLMMRKQTRLIFAQARNREMRLSLAIRYRKCTRRDSLLWAPRKSSSVLLQLKSLCDI